MRADRAQVLASLTTIYQALSPTLPEMGTASAMMAKSKANRMKTLTGKDANFGFGRLIDLARTEPAVIARSSWRWR